MTIAEISYRMCPSVPPMQCLRHRPCPFHIADATGKKDCHVADIAVVRQ